MINLKSGGRSSTGKSLLSILPKARTRNQYSPKWSWFNRREGGREPQGGREGGREGRTGRTDGRTGDGRARREARRDRGRDGGNKSLSERKRGREGLKKVLRSVLVYRIQVATKKEDLHSDIHELGMKAFPMSSLADGGSVNYSDGV